MEKKILRYQLYTLFILTTINLIYFYYRDTLPDNYYEISFQNQSINFLSYYLSSTLVNLGYWTGIWITISFVSFAILNTFFFNKKNDFKSRLVIFVLVPFCLGVSYLFIPDAIGEGLYFLVKENVNMLLLILSIIFFGASLFYLVSEKYFLQCCKYFWKLALASFEGLKKIQYSSLKNLNGPLVVSRVRSQMNLLVDGFKPSQTNQSQSKINTTPSPKLKPFAEKVSLMKASPLVTEELYSEDEHEDVEPEEIVQASDNDEVEENFNDSVIESEDELEDVESPFQIKSKNENKFFDSDELINCIAPKKTTNFSADPDNYYFENIARAIEEKLKEFNISAQIINVLKGPVVDTFELELGTGVKVSGVTNRTDDLSLALKGAPIRMVHPMKGKSTIGVEVPRNPRDVIYLDEVLKSEQFNSSSYKLPIAMGKDAYGDAAVIDLAATPHLLVAGTTGAGKSVFINTLLVSLIIKFSPKKLRLIMLDPKQLELALYQRLPHLVMPVVTDPQMASIALMWTIEEMERRYSLLKDFGVKNIDGFNKKFKESSIELTCKVNKYYPDAVIEDFELPYIVVVVDEFADLMLSKSGKAIETSISRLAAKARASGIHIVLATQRPSTDIITGVIKANFPTRVSFRVFTNIDSRVILDGVGAEKLLGKGDMLFKQGIDILRMHSAYVDENEIEALVDKLSTLPVEYDSDAMEFIENNGLVDDDVDGVTTDGEGGGLKDDKYDEAVRCVATHRVASASYLQRRLGVGYNRAANLIEEMERYGVVGPAQGSKPRKVLVPPPSDTTP